MLTNTAGSLSKASTVNLIRPPVQLGFFCDGDVVPGDAQLLKAAAPRGLSILEPAQVHMAEKIIT